MGIADFFRPKHRHSDVRVRTEAVKALTADDAAILEQVARSDRDIGVRRLALGKIDKPSLLADLAADETERSLREFAGERAGKLYAQTACATDADAANNALAGIVKLGDQHALVDVAVRAELAAIRKKAFGELRDPRALQELARGDGPQDLRIAAVGRIDDGDVLRAVAIDTTVKEVGLAAVDKIDDVDRLENVAAKAKNKAVRQRARKIVGEIEEAEKAKQPVTPDEVKRRRAEKAQLVREVEGVAESFDFAKAASVVETAEAAWAKLPAEDGDDRFTKAVERFKRRRQLHDEQARSADELRAIEKEASRERERDRAERAEREAAAKAPVPLDPEAEAKRAAADAEAKARRDEKDRERAEADAKRAAIAAERDARKKEDAERGAQIAASLTAMCADLEQLAGSNDGRAIDRALTQAAKAFEIIGKVPAAERDALVERYQAARGKLVIKASERREAEDWQRWSNVPKADALIATAKEMIDAAATPDLGNRLRGLQQLWKEVGPLPQKRSKELWDTFKALCDQVYEKVKGVRAVEGEKFADVAKAKEALIAEAEGLASSTDWAATADKLKALQAQWKASGHLPRKQGDELWKRFRAACDRFFEARKPQLEARHAEEAANLAKKQALVGRAQAVATKAPDDGGWGKAIGQIKDLQREWKEIGHVARRDADAIYKAFRAACDALFAKRDEARDGEANAHRAELDAIKAQIADVLATGNVETALAARAKARELGALATEIDAMIRHVITAHPDAVVGTELDPAAARGRRAKLVAKAEELLPKQPFAPTGEDLAAKLKNAMRANAFGDLRFSGRDPVEVIDELRQQWLEAGPIWDDADKQQVDAFEAVVARVLEAAGKPTEPRRRRSREQPAVAEPPPTAATAAAEPPPATPHVVAKHDEITQPATLPPPPVEAPAIPRTVTASATAEEVDSGWDLGDDDPTASPTAAEMASDGAPPDDALHDD